MHVRVHVSGGAQRLGPPATPAPRRASSRADTYCYTPLARCHATAEQPTEHSLLQVHLTSSPPVAASRCRSSSPRSAVTRGATPAATSSAISSSSPKSITASRRAAPGGSGRRSCAGQVPEGREVQQACLTQAGTVVQCTGQGPLLGQRQRRQAPQAGPARPCRAAAHPGTSAAWRARPRAAAARRRCCAAAPAAAGPRSRLPAGPPAPPPARDVKRNECPRPFLFRLARGPGAAQGDRAAAAEEVGATTRLREVELAGVKGAPRKLAGLCGPQAQALQRLQHRARHRRAAVDVQLRAVLACGRKTRRGRSGCCAAAAAAPAARGSRCLVLCRPHGNTATPHDAAV